MLGWRNPAFAAVMLAAAVLEAVSVRADVYWSAVASACMPEAKALQSNLYVNPSDFSVGLATGKNKPVVLVCPVEGKTAVLMPDMLGLTYKDSTGSGASASVKATLVRVDRQTGARATVATVSSNAGPGTGPAQVKTAPFLHLMVFETFYYYVRLDISRSASNQDVRAIGVSLETNCGDGVVTLGEICDDDNADDGDGCSSLCQEEPGYSCSGEPSVCQQQSTCGDGAITGSETCDDGDTTSGDGCSSSCNVENGASCLGQPSVCQAITCGDNIRAASEPCDGSDLGGATCASVNPSTPNGNLQCTACVLDTSGCTP